LLWMLIWELRKSLEISHSSLPRSKSAHSRLVNHIYLIAH
jgi:hypothetical protein